jgi:hypothetical protein
MYCIVQFPRVRHHSCVRARKHNDYPSLNPLRDSQFPLSPDERTFHPDYDVRVRWLELADFILSRGPTPENMAEMESLARREQDEIKRRVRRNVKLFTQAKSKH